MRAEPAAGTLPGVRRQIKNPMEGIVMNYET
jgi:hypothetical protein